MSSNTWHSFFFSFSSYFIKIQSLQSSHLIKIQSLQSSKSLQLSVSLNYYLSSSSYYLIKIMIALLSSFIQFKIVRYLLLHWRLNAIAAEVHCHVYVVYKIQTNLFIYEQLIRSQIHISVEDALTYYLENQFWTQQSEMIWYLWEKWDIYVHRSIVSRLLKRREWENKNARRIDSQSEELRQHWIINILNWTAKQLIFVDEFLFNKITDWRLRAYAFIDQSARYRFNIRSDSVWSVLSTYTLNDKCFISSHFYFDLFVL
jgi:hypothetical protein